MHIISKKSQKDYERERLMQALLRRVQKMNKRGNFGKNDDNGIKGVVQKFQFIIISMSRQHQKRFLLTGQDKYSKITHKNKILLIKRVILDEAEIKETAEALKINYSTAKTLMRKFKRHGEELNEEVIVGISRWYDAYSSERTRCSYRGIELPPRAKKSDKKQKKRQQQQTEQYQSSLRVSGVANEVPTPIDIYQQVLFRQ